MKIEKIYSGYEAMINGEKVPRKIKKKILGRRLSKGELKTLIKSVKIIEDEHGCHEIYPYAFCPKCGCCETRTIDHGVAYPEIWVDSLCLRCNSFVGGADNSRYVHILENIVYD